MKTSIRAAAAYLRSLIADTDNGLDRIVSIHPREVLRLSLWVIVYTSLTVALIYLCQLSIYTYSEFPVTTSIRVGNESFVRLPRIAICNVNPFKRAELCVPPYHVLCEANADFAAVFSNLSVMANQRKSDGNTSGMSADNSSVDGEEQGNTFIRHANRALYSLEEMVVSCTIRGQPCAANLDKFFKPLIVEMTRYGQCFCMFCNRRTENDPRRIVDLTDVPERGIVLLLDTKTETYLPHIDEFGFVLLFYSGSEDGTIPDITRDGVHAAIAHTTYMSLSATEQNLLSDPYPSHCDTKWPIFLLDTLPNLEKKPYSYGDCVQICINLQVSSLMMAE